MFNVPPHKEFSHKFTFKIICDWLKYNFVILRIKYNCSIHGHKYKLLYEKGNFGKISLKDDIYQCSVCQKRIMGNDLLMEERKRKIKSIL
jgi:hypothetical protein